MKYLLDTCAWLDAFGSPEQLRPEVLRLIAQESTLGLSAISPWEVAIKNAKGRLFLHRPIDEWMRMAIPGSHFRVMPITPEVAIESTRLPGNFHNDPADCLVVATARLHSLSIITSDARILSYRSVKSIASRQL
jgi:PIN domain nuclease of toxin-antitoxin system